MKLETLWKLMLSFLITPVLTFFTPVYALMGSLLWLVVIDILTGMYVAKFIDQKDLTSRGFLRKLPRLVLLFVALTAALHVNPFFAAFGFGEFKAAELVLAFYGAYEFFSIVENLGKMGLPIAKQLSEMLKAKLPGKVKEVVESSE